MLLSIVVSIILLYVMERKQADSTMWAIEYNIVLGSRVSAPTVNWKEQDHFFLLQDRFEHEPSHWQYTGGHSSSIY